MFLHEISHMDIPKIKDLMYQHITSSRYYVNKLLYKELLRDFTKSQLKTIICDFVDSLKNKEFGSERAFLTFYYKDLCFKTEYHLIHHLITYRTAKRRVEKLLKKYSKIMIEKIYAPGGNIYNKLLDANKKHFKEGQYS